MLSYRRYIHSTFFHNNFSKIMLSLSQMSYICIFSMRLLWCRSEIEISTLSLPIFCQAVQHIHHGLHTVNKVQNIHMNIKLMEFHFRLTKADLILLPVSTWIKIHLSSSNWIWSDRMSHQWPVIWCQSDCPPIRCGPILEPDLCGFRRFQIHY